MSGARHGLRRTPAGAALPEPVPADRVEVVRFTCRDDGIVPNNPDLPVLLLRGALPPGTSPAAIMALHEANGWRRVWHYTVFDYQHYHPDAHEVLSVASGWADLQLGGPAGDIHRVVEGDTVVLPAGTGHCRIDARDDFAVCGAYPPGQEGRTILRGIAQERPADVVARIAGLARPATDPIHGRTGPLLDAWA